MEDFDKAFQRYYGQRLDHVTLGFASAFQLISALDDIVSISECAQGYRLSLKTQYSGGYFHNKNTYTS